jgi:hypothetical protein
MVSRFRFRYLIFLPLACVLSAAASFAGTVSVDATGRGLLSVDTRFSGFSQNGDTSSGNYAVGGFGTTSARDFFDFTIPVGQWTSATLDLFEPSNGHTGGEATFSVFSIGAYGTYTYFDMGTGTFYGSVGLSSADNGTTVHIVLNQSALAAILGDQGSRFSLSGTSTGESSSVLDFGNTGSGGIHSTLTLDDTSASPEPGSIALFGAGLAGLLGLRYRKPAVR